MDSNFLLGLVFGFFVGFCFFIYRLKSALSHIVTDLNLDNKTTINQPILYTESHNNVILVYTNKTNNFVCQGNTLDEIAVNLLKSKIPHAFIVTQQDKVYEAKDGKLRFLKNES